MAVPLQSAKIPGSEDPPTFGSESIPAAYQEDWVVSNSLQISQSLEICSAKPSHKYTNSFRNVREVLEKEHKHWNKKQLELDRNINQLCYMYVVKALYDLGWVPQVGKVLETEGLPIIADLRLAFHHYLSYLKQENVLEWDTHILRTWPPTKSQVEYKIRNLVEVHLREYAPIKIIHAFGYNLGFILQGTLTGRLILFGVEINGNTLAELFYQQNRFHVGMFQAPAHVFISIAQKLWSVPRQYKEEKKYLRVLEIGSGTGTFTQKVLQRLSQHGIHFQYVFADFSPPFLARVEQIIGNDYPGGQVEFKVLNIENDPLEQGFPPNYFDVVVGVHVFHTTVNLRNALANVRKLVKRGGMLVIGEMEMAVREFDICFGTLDAYWLFQDTSTRQTHCTVSAPVWRSILEMEGFEMETLYDMHLHEGQISVMAAKLGAKHYEPPCLEREWLLIEASSENNISTLFSGRMRRLGRKVISKEFKEIVSNSEVGKDAQTEVDKLMTSLKDTLEGVVIWYDMSQTLETPGAEKSRQLLEPLLCVAKFLGRCGWRRVPKLRFISGGLRQPIGIPSQLSDVDDKLLWGFMRVLREEMPDIRSKSIELKITQDFDTDLICDSILNELWTDEDKETEVIIFNKIRQVRRLLQEKEEVGDNILEIPSGRYKIELPETGKLKDLKYVPKKSLESGSGGGPRQLGDNQVEVVVKSASLSYKDTMAFKTPGPLYAKGKRTIGLDFAGVVCRVGGNVTTMWSVGDPVFGFSWKKSTITSHLVVDSDMIQKIPENMTFNEAATLPTSFQIAWHCLNNLAGMQPDQTVLIHAASGAVGQACIQLAKHMKLRIIGTAGNSKKRNFLKSLGIQHVFSSRACDYGKDVMKVTKNQGVDAVLNCMIGRANVDMSQACCKPNGHFVELGKMVVWCWESDSEKRSDVTTHDVNMDDLPNDKLIVMMNELMELLKNGSFKPLTYIKYPAARIKEALKLLQDAVHIGKVVVEMPEVDSLSGGLREPHLFYEWCSYVITGELGDFGFAVAEWMLENGAKFLILVDSLPSSDRIKGMIAKMEKMGENRRVITRKCDISDNDECQKLFEDLCEDTNIPPIRGVHHCSRDRSDRLIEDQNWENVETVIVPRMNTAWNLHQATRHLPLDFFIVHSSTAGVLGSAGQSSYAAANCYMEGLMKARRGINLRGLSINWGHWKLGVASYLQFQFLQPFLIENGFKALEKLMKENDAAFPRVIGNLKFPGIIDIFPKYGQTLFENLPENREMEIGDETVPTLYRILQQRAKEEDDELYLELETKLVRNCVTTVLCNLLGVNDVKPEDNLLDMNWNSLMTVELIYKLQDEMGPIRVEFLDMRMYNTVEKMTKFLIDIFRKQFRRHYASF